LFFLLPVGRRVRVVDVETRNPLWPGGASEELPQNVTTTPVIVEQGDVKLIAAGCEDGNLYGWDMSDGRRSRMWPGRGAGLRAAPLVAGNVIVAGSADGNLCFFDLKGGLRGAPLALGGGVTSPPVLQRRIVYVGTSTNNALYAIDLDRQSALFAFRGDQIRGGVTCAPAISGNRVYFGTEEGTFYAFDREDRQTERLWSYSTLPTSSRLVSTPVVVGKRVIFVCASGKLFAFDD
jgi:outer membrane protein assembly factor BamB